MKWAIFAKVAFLVFISMPEADAISLLLIAAAFTSIIEAAVFLLGLLFDYEQRNLDRHFRAHPPAGSGWMDNIYYTDL